jgi:putative transcriptional regulator
MTGYSAADSSKRQYINFNHIEKIAEELDLTDIREIVDLVDDNGN